MMMTYLLFSYHFLMWIPGSLKDDVTFILSAL